MSEYVVVDSDIKKKEHILSSLEALGVPREEVECYVTPRQLKGFMNDRRPQKADIIVRADIVNKYLSGGASNDMGFELVDGVYRIHVCEYDTMKWWRKKRKKFLDEAAATQTIETLRKKGFKVTREDSEDEIILSYQRSY